MEGFLRSTGLTLDRLERRADKKGETFYAVVEKPGRAAAEIVAEVLEGVQSGGFRGRSRCAGDRASLRWVRPLQVDRLPVLSDETRRCMWCPLSVDGIVAGQHDRGAPLHG